MRRARPLLALAAGTVAATAGALLPMLGSTPAGADVVAAAPASAAATAGTWSTQPPSGLARQEVSYTAVDGKLYLAGGRSTVQQVFDPGAGTWRRVAPMPVALDHIQTTALAGAIYYVGGLTGYPQGASFGDVYVYHPVGDYFSIAAPLPAGRERGAGGIGVYQGRIYLAGGFHDGHSVPYFDSYDPATDSWTALPDLPGARDHVSAAVVGDRFYVIGGRQYAVAFRADNQAFDFATGAWVTGLAALPTLRSGAATAVFGSEIAVIGGEGGTGGGTHSTNEAYDTVAGTWRTLAPMPTARHGIQAAMDNGVAYLADGGLQVGGRSPTDIQEAFTLAVPGRPDCRVRLRSDAGVVGDNVYGLDGSGQTRAASAAPGTTRTFVLTAQNDAATTDTLGLRAPGSQAGFTVRYLAGPTGGTDVTADVVAGTYPAVSLAPGSRQTVRLQVTVATSVPSGTTASWLATATSTGSGARDACAAALSVP